MATDGVYAGDLNTADVVRVDAQIWRVSRVDRYGPDEVEVVLVNFDDTDQLILTLHPGQLIERVA